MKIRGELVSVGDISIRQKERMLELLRVYFDGVKNENFEQDLGQKQWVIFLRNLINGQIEGFSTQMTLENVVDGVPVKAVFSGDTIIDRKCWGSRELVAAWGDFIVSLIQKENVRFYWLLLSMGFRTYRFLPVYFHEFWPRFDKATPEFEQKVLDAFAFQKYPLEYNKRSGLVHFNQPRERLRPGVSDITQARLNDEHISYFNKLNPGWHEGDELVCLAELTEANMRPMFKRIISSRRELLLERA